MSEEPESFTYTREELLDEFVHPDDRPALEEAHQKRALWGSARPVGFDAPADSLSEDTEQRTLNPRVRVQVPGGAPVLTWGARCPLLSTRTGSPAGASTPPSTPPTARAKSPPASRIRRAAGS